MKLEQFELESQLEIINPNEEFILYEKNLNDLSINFDNLTIGNLILKDLLSNISPREMFI